MSKYDWRGAPRRARSRSPAKTSMVECALRTSTVRLSKTTTNTARPVSQHRPRQATSVPKTAIAVFAKRNNHWRRHRSPAKTEVRRVPDGIRGRAGSETSACVICRRPSTNAKPGNDRADLLNTPRNQRKSPSRSMTPELTISSRFAVDECGCR